MEVDLVPCKDDIMDDVCECAREDYITGVSVRFACIIFTVVSNMIACIYAYYKLHGCECLRPFCEKLQSNLPFLGSNNEHENETTSSGTGSNPSQSGSNDANNKNKQQNGQQQPPKQSPRIPAGYTNSGGGNSPRPPSSPGTTKLAGVHSKEHHVTRSPSMRNARAQSASSKRVEGWIVFGTFMYIFLATVVTLYNMVYRFVIYNHYPLNDCQKLNDICYISDVIDEYIIVFSRAFLLIFFTYRVEKVFADSVHEFNKNFMTGFRILIIVENVVLNTLWILSPSFGLNDVLPHDVAGLIYGDFGVYCWNGGAQGITLTHFGFDTIFNVMVVAMFASRLTKITSSLHQVSDHSASNKDQLTLSQNNFELVLVALRQLYFVFICIASSWIFYFASITQGGAFFSTMRWFYPLDWTINVWCVVLMFKFDKYGMLMKCFRSKFCYRNPCLPRTWKVALEMYSQMTEERKSLRKLQKQRSKQGSSPHSPHSPSSATPKTPVKMPSPMSVDGPKGILIHGRSNYSVDIDDNSAQNSARNSAQNSPVPATELTGIESDKKRNSGASGLTPNWSAAADFGNFPGIVVKKGQADVVSVASNSPLTTPQNDEQMGSGQHSPIMPASPRTDDEVLAQSLSVQDGDKNIDSESENGVESGPEKALESAV